MNALKMRVKFFLFPIVIVLLSKGFLLADESRDREIYKMLIEQEESLPRGRALEEAFREAKMKQIVEGATEEMEKDKVPVKPVFKASPYAKATLTYDDNIFQLPEKSSDLYYKLEAGISLFLGAELEYLRELSFKSNYQFDEGRLGEIGSGGKDSDGLLPTLKFNLGASMLKYKKNRSLDQKVFSNFNNLFIPDLGLEYKLGRGKRKFRIKQSITPSTESLSSITTGESGQVRYIASNTEIDWEQSFNRLGYNLGYLRDETFYEDSNKSNNYLDQKLIFGGFLQAFPKTRFFAEGNIGSGEYTRDKQFAENNVKYVKAYLGAAGSLSRKTIGTVKVGYQNREYKDGSQLKAPAVDININHEISPKTKAYMLISHDSNEGNYAADGFNKNTTATFSIIYAFNRKLSADLGIIKYMHDKYQSGRKDETFTSSVDLNYIFHKWMTMTFSWSRTERKSNISQAAFDNNKYTIAAKLEF